MNKICTSILFVLFSTFTFSQDIAGTWVGEIDFKGEKLGFAFNIIKNGNNYTSTMDIPLKGVKDAEAEKTLFENSKLLLSFAKYKVEFDGTFSDTNEIKGNLLLARNPVSLILKKGIIELNRPQEPNAPFDYYSETITFKTIDNYQLEGTLTLPGKDGNFPIVIIISGSGPQNRDGAMFGHKPYLVLADHLTKNGIGVLRFDERGVGKSEGNFKAATIETFSSDIESAIKYLKTRKDIDTSKMGLIGHSIGGIIAPEIAAKNSNINFIVLMAAPGINGDQLILLQKAALERGMGLNEMQIAQGQDVVKGAYDIIVNSKLNNQQLKDSINTFYVNKYGDMLPKNQRTALVEQLSSNEIIGLVRSKPAKIIEKVKCPVLAINGDKDFQVPSKENLNAIEIATKKGNNKKVEIVELKNLNHLFQECSTGFQDEYSKIEQTMSPATLNIISNWIKKQVK